MPRSRKYQEWLIEQLKNHDEAVAYLNGALEESLKGMKSLNISFLSPLETLQRPMGVLGT